MQISWAFKHFHIGNRHVFSKNTLGTSLAEEDIYHDGLLDKRQIFYFFNGLLVLGELKAQ